MLGRSSVLWYAFVRYSECGTFFSGVAKLYLSAACTCRLNKRLETWENGCLYQYFVGTCLANSCITQVDALERAIDRRGKQSALDPHIRRSAVSLDVDAFCSSSRLDLDRNFCVMVFVL